MSGRDDRYCGNRKPDCDIRREVYCPRVNRNLIQGPTGTPPVPPVLTTLNRQNVEYSSGLTTPSLGLDLGVLGVTLGAGITFGTAPPLAFVGLLGGTITLVAGTVVLPPLTIGITDPSFTWTEIVPGTAQNLTIKFTLTAALTLGGANTIRFQIYTRPAGTTTPTFTATPLFVDIVLPAGVIAIGGVFEATSAPGLTATINTGDSVLLLMANLTPGLLTVITGAVSGGMLITSEVPVV